MRAGLGLSRDAQRGSFPFRGGGPAGVPGWRAAYLHYDPRIMMMIQSNKFAVFLGA